AKTETHVAKSRLRIFMQQKERWEYRLWNAHRSSKIGPTSAGSDLHVDFLEGLDDDEAVSLEEHLQGLAGAASEEGFQGNVRLELRGEGAAPGDGRVRVGDDGAAGLDAEGERLEVAGDGEQSAAVEADVEQAAG